MNLKNSTSSTNTEQLSTNNGQLSVLCEIFKILRGGHRGGRSTINYQRTTNFSVFLLFFRVSVVLFCLVSSNAFAILVTGKVIDEKGFPVPEITVYTNSNGSATTDSEGKFILNTDKTPFDISLWDNSNSVGIIYRGISLTTLELILFGNASERNANTEALKVEFNTIPKGKSAIIKFVSSELFYSEPITASSGEKNKVLTVTWPSKTNTINGKIIYIEKSNTTYDKYSEKAYTVLKDFYPQIVRFDSASAYSSIWESYLTVYLPSAAVDKKGFSVSADFLSLHRNSEMLINSMDGDLIMTKCMVPGSLSYGYRLKLTGYGINNNGSGYNYMIYTYPGSVVTIQPETPPALTSPQDKFYGVSGNTEFGYEWGSGTGVYVINFHSYNPVGDFYIVTKEKFVSSPMEFASGILKGEDFSWNVTKYMTYVTTNDFVKPLQFGNDLSVKSVSFSETRTFKKKLF